MELPPANVTEKIVRRRSLPAECNDQTDSRNTGRPSNLYQVHEETMEIAVPIVIKGRQHSKYMTVSHHTQEGNIYITDVQTTRSSVFRPDDELVALDGELIKKFNVENIQNLFSFDTDNSGRRVKNVTIKRTDYSESKTEEIDVEIVIATENLFTKTNVTAKYRRNVKSVKARPELTSRQALIQTSNGKYLTVRNERTIVGDDLPEDNMGDFTFHLEPMKAKCSQKLGYVPCSKIRWGSLFVKTLEESDGALGLELSEDDSDDFSSVYRLRMESNGWSGIRFESISLKNVYLQYSELENEVDVQHHEPGTGLKKTLRYIPPPTVFNLIIITESTNAAINSRRRRGTGCFSFLQRHHSHPN